MSVAFERSSGCSIIDCTVVAKVRSRIVRSLRVVALFESLTG